MTLAKALEDIRRGDHGAARDRLIPIWRKRRAPVIADAIDVLDAQAPDATSAAIASIVTPRVTSSLANLKQLAKVDDPRLARWAIDALVKLPFTATSARPFLVAIARIAARHQDPRLAARADDIRSALATRIGRLALRVELQAIVDRAPRVKVPAGPLDAALAAAIEPLRSSTRSAEALLAEIYASPADDGPRLVYADMLTAAGDPRGELIVLQLQRGDDAEPSERERTLLAKHGKAWLGELAPVLSWGKGYARTTFRRGFVSRAHIILSVGKKLRPILTHPAWATVEELHGFYTDRDELLLHAPLRALRSLDVRAEWLPGLARRAEKLTGIQRVQLSEHEAVDGAALRAAFPNVTTVVVRLRSIDRTSVDRFTSLAVDQVELSYFERDGLQSTVGELVGTPASVGRLRIANGRNPDDRIELVRDASGTYARAS